jgi:hypothetical protein
MNPVSGARFQPDIFHMSFHGAWSDGQHQGDLFRRHTARDETDDF